MFSATFAENYKKIVIFFVVLAIFAKLIQCFIDI